jgi:hypothetical protein
MRNSHTRPSGIKPHLVDFYYRGYTDFQLNLSYRKDYETWQERDQKNYENGRLAAAEGKTLPPAILKAIPKTTKASSALLSAAINGLI